MNGSEKRKPGRPKGIETHSLCGTCGKIKARGHFRLDKRGHRTDGKCRACRNLTRREDYHTSPEVREAQAAYSAKWYQQQKTTIHAE